MFDFSEYLLSLVDLFKSLMTTSPFDFVLYYAFTVLVLGFVLLIIKAIRRNNS